jgi:hypothetical protein
MRCIHSFLSSNLAGYTSNNSCRMNYTVWCPEREACAHSQSGTELHALQLETKNLAAGYAQQREGFSFQRFLPTHVQGNQNVPLCLEEKHRLYRNRTVLTISARGTVSVCGKPNAGAYVVGFSRRAYRLKKYQVEPCRVIARRAREDAGDLNRQARQGLFLC